MFIPRMWFDEVERIGMRRYTPIGYRVKLVGEMVGFLGLLMLPGVLVYLAYKAALGTLHLPLLWLLALPFIVGIVDTLIAGIAWTLAERKQFRYDSTHRISRWMEEGKERTYTGADLEAELLRRPA